MHIKVKLSKEGKRRRRNKLHFQTLLALQVILSESNKKIIKHTKNYNIGIWEAIGQHVRN